MDAQEDVPWCTLPWNDPRIIDIKNELHLEALPQVLVLDRNLRIITTEGADDLLNLESNVCRTLWINRLQKLIRDDKGAHSSDGD